MKPLESSQIKIASFLYTGENRVSEMLNNLTKTIQGVKGRP